MLLRVMKIIPYDCRTIGEQEKWRTSRCAFVVDDKSCGISIGAKVSCLSPIRDGETSERKRNETKRFRDSFDVLTIYDLRIAGFSFAFV